jgi:hypothetical protein
MHYRNASWTTLKEIILPLCSYLVHLFCNLHLLASKLAKFLVVKLILNIILQVYFM